MKDKKNTKQIIGYTSGVFDMFHIGHLNLLKRAKSLCDRLIVGVTIDELVSYKNTKAIIPFKDRAEIVQNIKCVDLVIPQDNLNKFEMWKKLKFDVMFIGDDWYNTKRFEQFEMELSKVGVKIIYLPYTKKVSTTILKNKFEFTPLMKNDNNIKSSIRIKNIINKIISNKNKLFKSSPLKVIENEDIEKYFKKIDRNKKKLVLATQLGRGGMKWICEIFSAHKNVRGKGERNRTAEAFYRYISWNKLPIDTSGFINIIKKEALDDWEKVDISLISSPYFSYNFLYIYNELKPDKIIWAINDPVFTVTSFYNKGWYSNDYITSNINLTIGIQPFLKDEWSHFFGRIIPFGGFFNEWKKLTRIGKISWFLNEIAKEIYSSIKQIPKEKVWIFRLEEADQNYDYYLNMSNYFGLRPKLSKHKFLSLKKKATKKGENIPKVWTKKEKEEFDKYASDYISIYKKVK